MTMTPLLSYTLNTFVIHLASMPAVPWLRTSIFILTLPSNCLTDTPLPLAGRLLMGSPVGSTGLLFLTYHPYVNASSERAKIPFLRATLDALKPLSWFCTTSGGHLLQKTATNVLMAAQPASAPNPSIKSLSASSLQMRPGELLADHLLRFCHRFTILERLQLHNGLRRPPLKDGPTHSLSQNHLL